MRTLLRWLLAFCGALTAAQRPPRSTPRPAPDPWLRNDPRDRRPTEPGWLSTPRQRERARQLADRGRRLEDVLLERQEDR